MGSQYTLPFYMGDGRFVLHARGGFLTAPAA